MLAARLLVENDSNEPFDSATLKVQGMESFIQVCQCLSDPKSVRIVLLLLESDLKINQLERATNLSRRVIDTRLVKMHSCNVVSSEMDGRWIRWCLTAEAREMVKLIVANHVVELEWDPDVTADRIRLARELQLDSSSEALDGDKGPKLVFQPGPDSA